jgi:hypothetical protein
MVMTVFCRIKYFCFVLFSVKILSVLDIPLKESARCLLDKDEFNWDEKRVGDGRGRVKG